MGLRALEVEVLDALSIGVSMLRGDFGTAGSVMFLLRLGELLEEWTRKKSLGDLARCMSLNVDRVWQQTAEGEYVFNSGDVSVLFGVKNKVLYCTTDTAVKSALDGAKIESLMSLDGIVIVTSPQELVSMIVSKAVNMASLMNIRVLGLVENMSYVLCPDCGKHVDIFGAGKTDAVAAAFGFDLLARIPLDARLAALCDKGALELMENDYLSAAADKMESIG